MYKRKFSSKSQLDSKWRVAMPPANSVLTIHRITSENINFNSNFWYKCTVFDSLKEKPREQHEHLLILMEYTPQEMIYEHKSNLLWLRRSYHPLPHSTQVTHPKSFNYKTKRKQIRLPSEEIFEMQLFLKILWSAFFPTFLFLQ